MSQIKEEKKMPEKELNKMETSNLPDTESKNTGYKDTQGALQQVVVRRYLLTINKVIVSIRRDKETPNKMKQTNKQKRFKRK